MPSLHQGGLANLREYVGQVLHNVWVNEVPYSNAPPIMDAELWLSFGCHDLFILRLEVPRLTPTNNLRLWPDDTPIRITWGRSPDIRTWYGYVNHSEVKNTADSGSNAQQIEYVCIGTSAILNADASRAWQSVSATYIAKKIARENNLRAVVSPVDWVLDYETQVNESDFNFLCRIADKVGLRFWCSNSTIYMVAPDVMLTGSLDAIPPTYTVNKNFTEQDTLRHFQQLSGQNIPGSVVAQRAIFGTDVQTGTPFSAVNVPKRNPGTSRVVIKQDTAVQNYHDAKQRIDASARLSQFSIQATGEVFGNTTLYPGKLIVLSGNALPNNMTGSWLLTSTCHKLRTSYTANTAKDTYVTEVTMVRNRPGGVSLVNVTPIRPEFPLCVLNTAGTWFSSSPNVITESATKS